MPSTDQINSTLRAAVDRIIPQDQYMGAWEAGVGQFIERILQTDLHDAATGFFEGLAGLNAEAIAWANKPFASLDSSQQDAILTAVQNGQIKTKWTTPPQEFFTLLVNLTAEGFYGDPANGGNRDMVSWNMIGYEPRGQTP